MHRTEAVSPADQGGIGPRGLIVDWGGVLTPSLDVAMASWAHEEAVNFEHFRAVLRDWARPTTPESAAPVIGARTPLADLEQASDTGPAGHSPVHLLERGELSVADFEHELAAALAVQGSPVRAEGLLGRLLSGLTELDPRMLDLVRRMRAGGVRTALLSNSWGDHYPEQLWDGLFDAVVISGQVGMRKPEPQIFLHTCAQVGLPPAQCVMVDDLPHNVEAAIAVGLVGVLHSSYDQTAAQVEELFRPCWQE